MAYSITSSHAGCYPNSTVLINKLGLQKQEALDEAERVAVTLRSVELEKAEDSSPFTFEFYCKLHEHLSQTSMSGPEHCERSTSPKKERISTRQTT